MVTCNAGSLGETLAFLTKAEFIRDAARRLSEAGVEQPDADAEWLLAWATGRGRLAWRLNPDEPLSSERRELLGAALARRVAREPLQYIVGEAAFLDATLEVAPGVLIPRPETEQLVLAAIEVVAGRGDALRVLDWGTGSGCIALALARLLPAAEVHAVDISPRALGIARRNAGRSAAGDRVRFWESDGFDRLPPGLRFDLIVSNPPYISAGDLAGLPPEVREHEPRSALDGGADGLDCYRRLAAEAPARLAPGGWFVAEFGDGQGASLAALFGAPPWYGARVGKDLSGRGRILIVNTSSAGLVQSQSATAPRPH